MEHLLFDPVAVGPIVIPNRFFLPAMHLGYTPDGVVTDRLIAWYRARAEGGVGMLVLGGCPVESAGGDPFMVGISDDRFVPGLKRFVHEVRGDRPTRIAAQLFHAGRYAFSDTTGEQAVAPSPLASPYNRALPREMTPDDIERVQSAFAAAALRAAEAGFDAVELVASAGYLIGQFLSPAANQRDDDYNGSLELRARFGVECLQRVRTAVGDRLAVLIRIAGADYVPDGNANEEQAAAARLFAEAGADAINVTGGWHESRVPQTPMFVPAGAFRYLAAGVKRAVDIPVIASNRLGDPALAARLIARGDADLIAMGRPLNADPELPAKVARGASHLVRPCIGCNQGCFDAVFTGQPVGCAVNPRAGHELDRDPAPASVAKKVVVIGAGPAGVEAALLADERGHDVVLFEQRPFIGGHLWMAAALPGRDDVLRGVDYRTAALVESGVDVRLGLPATPELVCAERAEVVVLATGATSNPPEVMERATHPNVVTTEDVLSDTALLRGDVVVLGGDRFAVETAIAIARRDTLSPDVAAFLLENDAESPERVKALLTSTRRAIHLVATESSLARDLGKTTRWIVLQTMRRLGIVVHLSVEILALTRAGVRFRAEEGERLTSPPTQSPRVAGIASAAEQRPLRALDREDGTNEHSPLRAASPAGRLGAPARSAICREALTLPADTIVVTPERRPNDALVEVLREAGCDVLVVGDARRPGRAQDAVLDGFLTVLKL